MYGRKIFRPYFFIAHHVQTIHELSHQHHLTHDVGAKTCVRLYFVFTNKPNTSFQQ